MKLKIPKKSNGKRVRFAAIGQILLIVTRFASVVTSVVSIWFGKITNAKNVIVSVLSMKMMRLANKAST